MNTNQYTMGKVEWIMLLALSLLWGFSFINIKNSLDQIPPFTLVFLRLCIAFSALFLWCLISKQKLRLSAREQLLLLGGGLLSCAIPFSFFTWGQQHVSTSIGAIFNGSVPFFTAFLAHFFIGGSERMSWRKALGLGMGMLGIITIMGIDKLSNFDLTSLGQLSMICACFFYGCSGIYYQKFVPDHIDKTVVTTYTLIWAAIAMSLVSINIEGIPSFEYRLDVWLSLFILALFSTALAYIILFRLLKRAGPSNTSLNTFIIPVVGIFVGISLLGESLNSQDIFGVVLIFSGVAIIRNFDSLLKKLLRQKVPSTTDKL
ncbi:EamA family transporter ['Osedax' symbiont bacterium Rs2_46_30_T18]|nr:EamA family transporter ['Osedax' symbiont bacterium Rs2_46_30_T18]